MSEPMNRKAQSVSQVPNSETKSCEMCKHHYLTSLRPSQISCCDVVQRYDFHYGMDGCAYEPINNIELPASRVTQEGHDGE